MKKQISRQLRWQRKKNEQGLCKICGVLKVFKAGECEAHYIKHRKSTDRWIANNKEKHLASLARWRKEHPDYMKKYYQRNKKNGE